MDEYLFYGQQQILIIQNEDASHCCSSHKSINIFQVAESVQQQ